MDGGGGQQVHLLAKLAPEPVTKVLGIRAEEGKGLHLAPFEGVQYLPLVAAVILIDAGDGESPRSPFAGYLEALAHPDPEAHRQRFARQHLVGSSGPAPGQQGIGGFELGDKVHLRPLDGLPLPAGGEHGAAGGGAHIWRGEDGVEGLLAEGAPAAGHPLGSGDVEIGGQALAEPDLHARAKARHHDPDADGCGDGQLQRHHRDGGAIQVIEGFCHPEPGGEGAACTQPPQQGAKGIGQQEGHGEQPASGHEEGAAKAGFWPP